MFAQFTDKKDSIIKEIINYIKDNPGSTQNMVSKYMDETRTLCSRLTTLKTINDLISKDVIEDRKEGNRFHSLYLNDRNEFNRIDREISEIDSIIKEMDKPMDRLFQISTTDLKKDQFSDKANLHLYFHYPYRDSVSTILQLLLLWTSTKIKSRSYSQLLYASIIKLMLKLTLQTFNLRDPKALLENDITALNYLKQVKSTVAFAEKKGINIKVGDNLIAKMKFFEKQFLDDEMRS